MVKLSDGLLGWVSEVVDGRLADVEPLYLETGRDSGSFTFGSLAANSPILF
jgi:hypothetical protein